MALFVLGLVSFASWFFSMLAGAGSPLILIPLVSALCGSAAVPPVITLGMLLGNGQRSVFLWEKIDWRITAWYLPGAIAGGILGAYCFSLIQMDWLQWVLAIVLIALALYQWRTEKTEAVLRLEIKPWHFLPLAFLNGMGSALIGSTGPILNPAYLGYGLVKESMIATKAFHNTMLHIVKVVAYVYLGTMVQEHLVYGLVIGAAALPGNWLGQMVLRRMSPEQFKKAVLAFVAFSGLLMLGRQLTLVL
ncbi:MAG: sulfite exporter TauE/SafE family protein [Synechococcales cyanobacterium CRU_2_2]|nr:sulfite exporter TauE/SafE family protein [Synechococcales cyanobacterium CRU_2_2]